MAASTFSYAQAAKGVSTPVSQSKPASGAATPAKDVGAKAANGPVGSVPSWADDAESESATEQTTTTREVQAPAPSAAPAQPTQSVETSSISSPDLGASASSASTVTKDDDVSSLPNASSESTWDNKSQASTSVDKSVEPAEKTSEKVKKGKNAVVKPLQEAPLPAVNPWKKRADELKSKIQKPTLSNGVSHGASTKKGESDAKAQSATGAGRFKSDEDRSAHSRKESRAETETKKDGKAKSAASAQLPPPKRDQESWPTPETVINEDRKKAQEKGEKEPKESVPVASNGKNEWVKVPFTPSVVFNTPLPNAAGSRRGGRPSGRGGAQPGGRPTTYGGSQPEKDGSAPVITNGDHSKRERVEGAATQDASPKTKRTGSAASPTLKNQAPAATSEKPAKAHGLSGAEPEFRPRTAQSAPDASQAGHHGNTYPRQFSNRPNKPRRGDMSFAGERRRDGEVSPAKDNTFDPAATQTEAHADGDRRHSTYHEGPNGHQQKHGRFGSYAGGRERGRGGGRGGRGSYANGHQYSSSHMSAQSTSSFSLGPRSPTTFNPENPSFFAAPQGKYGRNGHRSQSVTTDPYRFAPYQAGPPVAPINTYGMYDYSMMQQPMSAVPYAPYVDQFALMAMLTTQVEYYFSVDNLLKDMYLRRRMDSQGFVSLEFIAGFNRIKHLSTDLELIKLVCQQSSVVQYRTGEDGQDRLRRREGWEQWVLAMADRDAVAQNEGPKELHQPPVPQPTAFDQSTLPQWPMSAGEAPGPYGSNGTFPQMNGYSHSGAQDEAPATDSLPNGTTPEEPKDGAVPNGHPVEASIKAVSSEPDSFSNAQIATLTVIVRKLDQSRSSTRPLNSKTYSNGSVDSKHGVQYEPEEALVYQVNSTDSSDSSTDSHVPGLPQTLSPLRLKSPTPVHLYWVKNQEAPVLSIPPDYLHESYHSLRAKALKQRHAASLGTTPYDMDVLYQFWSHFLLRNFNTQMYDEFRYFAFQDATGRVTNVGLSNLVKFYGESLLSSQGKIREKVARHFIDLVQMQNRLCLPAFRQLRSAFRDGTINPPLRKVIVELLDDGLLASLAA